jgi:hypothetical protein
MQPLDLGLSNLHNCEQKKKKKATKYKEIVLNKLSGHMTFCYSSTE